MCGGHNSTEAARSVCFLAQSSTSHTCLTEQALAKRRRRQELFRELWASRGKEERLLEGTWRIWLRKKEWGVALVCPEVRYHTGFLRGFLGSASLHSWHGCGLGLGDSWSRTEAWIGCGWNTLLVCDRDQRRHESHSPTATMQPQARAGGDLGKNPCTCGHRKCNYWNCGEWQWWKDTISDKCLYIIKHHWGDRDEVKEPGDQTTQWAWHRRYGEQPTGWLKEQKGIVSWFWRLEVWNQGVGRVGSFPWFADGCLPSVCVSILISFYENTSPIGLGLALISQF